MNHKISIILTNYNHAQYIETAYKSIQEQTYKNIEVIIVDDCSTDHSRDVIVDIRNIYKNFSTKTIFLQENRGKWYALNKGISEASGEIIGIQDADDASCKQRIEIQYNVMQKYQSYHNLSGFKHCYSEEDMQEYKHLKEITDPKTMDHSTILKHVITGHHTPGINHYYAGPDFETHGASCLFYKQLWSCGIKFLPGNMDLRCKLAEDGDFNTKMTLLMQKTSVVMEPLYFYRRNTSTNHAWKEAL
jgi:glycosyltransferase involved in cell wall biosynthesis